MRRESPSASLSRKDRLSLCHQLSNCVPVRPSLAPSGHLYCLWLRTKHQLGPKRKTRWIRPHCVNQFRQQSSAHLNDSIFTCCGRYCATTYLVLLPRPVKPVRVSGRSRVFPELQRTGSDKRRAESKGSTTAGRPGRR